MNDPAPFFAQEQVDNLIRAMVYAVAKEDRAEEIAQFTVDETELGNYDGKYLKIHRKTRATLMDIIDDKSVGVIEEIPERNIVKIAKPVGVIGAFCPDEAPLLGLVPDRRGRWVWRCHIDLSHPYRPVWKYRAHESERQ